MRVRSIIKQSLILVVLLLPALAYGAPFLTCDDPPVEQKVTHYTVNGAKVESLTTGKALWYDLAAIPDGEFSLQVRACDVWDCSDPVPFVSRRVVPAAPAGWRLESGE